MRVLRCQSDPCHNLFLGGRGICLYCSPTCRFRAKGRRRRIRHGEPLTSELNKQRRTEKHLMIKYGLTLASRNAMASEFEESCAICGSNVGPMHVDHNHSTGQVRGLLCRPCNFALGLLKDDETIIFGMLKYLEWWRLHPEFSWNEYVAA